LSSFLLTPFKLLTAMKSDCHVTHYWVDTWTFKKIRTYL